MIDFDFEIDLSHLLPRGSGRFAMGIVYTVWFIVSLAFIVFGFYQDSTLLSVIHFVAGTLFLLALFVFFWINLMTAGNPGCLLAALQNGLAMLLMFTVILLFFFGYAVDEFFA